MTTKRTQGSKSTRAKNAKQKTEPAQTSVLTESAIKLQFMPYANKKLRIGLYQTNTGYEIRIEDELNISLPPIQVEYGPELQEFFKQRPPRFESLPQQIQDYISNGILAF